MLLFLLLRFDELRCPSSGLFEKVRLPPNRCFPDSSELAKATAARDEDLMRDGAIASFPRPQTSIILPEQSQGQESDGKITGEIFAVGDFAAGGFAVDDRFKWVEGAIGTCDMELTAAASSSSSSSSSDFAAL